MKKLLITSFVFLLCTFVVMRVRAQDASKSVEEQIQELTQKISDAQSKERSLSSEIKSMDATIALTQLQIRESQEKIAALGQEIEDLGSKITTLESTLSKLSKLLINRVVASYKVHQVSALSLLLTSTGLGDLINRTKYIEVVQEHDRQVLTDIEQSKTDFKDKKDLRETKKLEQEAAKKQLEIQQQKLNQQKLLKQELLKQTRNDETTYQKLLQQALAEKQAIEAALITGSNVGPVKAGDPIALVGNTGYPACSTGAHLHFEMRVNNQWVDPDNYLQSKSVADQQEGGTASFGTGDWQWPLSGDIIVTQHYGKTPYSWRYAYSGGIHTGIDMYSNTSAIIRAPKDGTLYSASQDCGGSTIKIKYIDHGNGLMSFYLHVQ
jgi:peptidoglycan hydrolase CwlO-like protein